MHGVGEIGDFRRKSPFISETVRDRPMTTIYLFIMQNRTRSTTWQTNRQHGRLIGSYGCRIERYHFR